MIIFDLFLYGAAGWGAAVAVKRCLPNTNLKNPLPF
jgi:hypothetical protein